MILNVLENIPDNYFYGVANRYVRISEKAQAEKQYLKSWGLAALARVPYLLDTIVDLAVGIFATFGALVGAVKAIGGDAKLFHATVDKLVQKIDHFCISLFGAVISPYLAYKGRDVHLVYFVGRVITFQWLFN